MDVLTVATRPLLDAYRAATAESNNSDDPKPLLLGAIYGSPATTGTSIDELRNRQHDDPNSDVVDAIQTVTGAIGIADGGTSGTVASTGAATTANPEVAAGTESGATAATTATATVLPSSKRRRIMADDLNLDRTRLEGRVQTGPHDDLLADKLRLAKSKKRRYDYAMRQHVSTVVAPNDAPT